MKPKRRLHAIGLGSNMMIIIKMIIIMMWVVESRHLLDLQERRQTLVELSQKKDLVALACLRAAQDFEAALELGVEHHHQEEEDDVDLKILLDRLVSQVRTSDLVELTLVYERGHALAREVQQVSKLSSEDDDSRDVISSHVVESERDVSRLEQVVLSYQSSNFREDNTASKFLTNVETYRAFVEAVQEVRGTRLLLNQQRLERPYRLVRSTRRRVVLTSHGRRRRRTYAKSKQRRTRLILNQQRLERPYRLVRSTRRRVVLTSHGRRRRRTYAKSKHNRPLSIYSKNHRVYGPPQVQHYPKDDSVVATTTYHRKGNKIQHSTIRNPTTPSSMTLKPPSQIQGRHHLGVPKVSTSSFKEVFRDYVFCFLEELYETLGGSPVHVLRFVLMTALAVMGFGHIVALSIIFDVLDVLPEIPNHLQLLYRLARRRELDVTQFKVLGSKVMSIVSTALQCNTIHFLGYELGARLAIDATSREERSKHKWLREWVRRHGNVTQRAQRRTEMFTRLKPFVQSKFNAQSKFVVQEAFRNLGGALTRQSVAMVSNLMTRVEKTEVDHYDSRKEKQEGRITLGDWHNLLGTEPMPDEQNQLPGLFRQRSMDVITPARAGKEKQEGRITLGDWHNLLGTEPMPDEQNQPPGLFRQRSTDAITPARAGKEKQEGRTRAGHSSG